MTVGDLIRSAGLPGTVLADRACGGNHRIPLFCLDRKSWETQLCNVDMLLATSGKVKVIFEIEESNVKPTQIFGKLVASALCSHYIYRNEDPDPMDDSVLFIQVLDTSTLNKKTLKLKQWKIIEKLVADTLPIRGSKINKYRLFHGDQHDFSPESETGKQLIECVRNFLTKF